jgi:hypothetical protein
VCELPDPGSIPRIDICVPHGGFIPQQMHECTVVQWSLWSSHDYAVVKKSRVCPAPKHSPKVSLISHVLRFRCEWVGQEFGDFLDLCDKVFFLIQYHEGDLTPRWTIFLIWWVICVVVYSMQMLYSFLNLSSSIELCAEQKSTRTMFSTNPVEKKLFWFNSFTQIDVYIKCSC